ncbi:hypothetical protein HanPSC8_Chr03g0099681 [Helianthus annuus]|nr:hypothetical protein HanPSC8_Chr03g0099681 [Helianthus annuus]
MKIHRTILRIPRKTERKEKLLAPVIFQEWLEQRNRMLNHKKRRKERRNRTLLKLVL